MAIGGLLLLAVACSEETPLQPQAVTAAPDAQATITAASRQPQTGPPPPTAVPASAMEAAQGFASGYQDITASLAELHLDFDVWQAGLNDCTQTAVRTDLRRFAGSFASITQSARELTRASSTRGLADHLIEAAEAEENALRQLRDRWQPLDMASAHDSLGDSGPSDPDGSDDADSDSGNGTNGPAASAQGSLLERVDDARSSSSATLREVTDALTDQEERTTTQARELLDDFSLAFRAANVRWDLYHQEYDSFRAEQTSLTSAEEVTRLSELVAKFSELMVAVRELPRLDATQEVADLMAEAADAEDLALRRLRATFQKSTDEEIDTSPRDVLDPESALDDSDGDSSSGSFVAGDHSLFSAYESQVVGSNTTRRQALNMMSQITLSLSEDSQSGLAAFDAEYQSLRDMWNAFDRDYEEWLRTEGGCDRQKAAETLVGFGVQMSQIASSVRDLPSTNILRPLEELLVVAVQREESALRQLSDSWRPYDPQAYQPFRDQRLAAGKLTRQVGVGIQELLEQYGGGSG